MKNALFVLIKTKYQQFLKLYNISENTAESHNQYFLIEPKDIDTKRTIALSGHLYRLVSLHISVYEDLRSEVEGAGKASYHVTLNILSEDESTALKVRVYYSHNHQYLYHTIKNAEDLNITVDSRSVLQFAKAYMFPFSQLVSNSYQELHSSYNEKFEKALDNLNKQGHSLHTIQQTDIQGWHEYQKSILSLIELIEEWHLYQPDIKEGVLNFLMRLSKTTAEKLQQLEESQLKSTGDIEATEKTTEPKSEDITKGSNKKGKQPATELRNINKALARLNDDKKLSVYEKLVKKHQLLMKKFEFINHDDEVLNCVLAIKDLEKDAHQALVKMMLDKKEYDQAIQKENVVEELIKLLPSFNIRLISLAVNNTRPQMLRLLLKHCNYLNIDEILPSNNLTLLELAYQKGLLDIFKILLEFGAFCDTQDARGYSILARACEAGRKDEMVALLQAHASATLLTSKGFTAFGILTMDKLPNLELVSLFIANCPSLIIDMLQGPPTGRRGTPLTYACQNNWIAAAELYLKNEASPSCAREGDKFDAMQICAGKGYIELGKVLFEYDYPITKCEHALKLATHFGHVEFVKLLNERIQRAGPSFQFEDYREFPVSTPLSQIYEAMNMEKKPQRSKSDSCSLTSEDLTNLLQLGVLNQNKSKATAASNESNKSLEKEKGKEKEKESDQDENKGNGGPSSNFGY